MLKKIKHKDSRQITLTNIRIEIENLSINSEEKNKLIKLADDAIKFALANKLDFKFWKNVTYVYQLLTWLKDKIH